MLRIALGAIALAVTGYAIKKYIDDEECMCFNFDVNDETDSSQEKSKEQKSEHREGEN